MPIKIKNSKGIFSKYYTKLIRCNVRKPDMGFFVSRDTIYIITGFVFFATAANFLKATPDGLC